MFMNLAEEDIRNDNFDELIDEVRNNMVDHQVNLVGDEEFQKMNGKWDQDFAMKADDDKEMIRI